MPIKMPSGKVGRGHLIPQLDRFDSVGFVEVESGKPSELGMVAFVGVPVTADDLLERWEEKHSTSAPREICLARLEEFVVQIREVKLGRLVSIHYAQDGSLEIVDAGKAPGIDKPRLP